MKPRRRHPRSLVLLVALAAAVFGTVSCSTTTSTRNSGTAEPGSATRVEQLRLAGSNNVGYPNPFGAKGGTPIPYVSLLYDTLLWKDGNGVPQPWLAARYEVSPDGKTWRFFLRPDITWQDGQPLTADDVVFTWNYMATGPGKTATGSYSALPVTSVVAESPTVVTFTTEPAYAMFLDRVAARQFIVPKHVWESVADPEKYRDPQALMGSGPYRLESSDEAAGSYLFIASDSYFLGPPRVRRIEFVPAPNELLALERGEIDAANVGSGGAADQAVPDEALAPFQNPKYGILEAPGTVGRALHFNLKQGFPYNDVRFRQALAYAINREDLLKRILLGRGELGNMGALEPSNSPYFAKDAATYPFDVAKAKALLDQIGMKDVDGDGVRELPDGRKFNPEMLTNSTWSPKTAEAILEYLRAVGIDVTIKSQDQATSLAATRAGRYEMALIGYGFYSDSDGLRLQFSSKLEPTSFAYVHGWENPRFEELADRQLSVVDQAERVKLTQEMQRLIANDVPIINLYTAPRMVIYDKGVLTNWFLGGGISAGMVNKEIFVLPAKPAGP